MVMMIMIGNRTLIRSTVTFRTISQTVTSDSEPWCVHELPVGVPAVTQRSDPPGPLSDLELPVGVPTVAQRSEALGPLCLNYRWAYRRDPAFSDPGAIRQGKRGGAV